MVLLPGSCVPRRTGSVDRPTPSVRQVGLDDSLEDSRRATLVRARRGAPRSLADPLTRWFRSLVRVPRGVAFEIAPKMSRNRASRLLPECPRRLVGDVAAAPRVGPKVGPQRGWRDRVRDHHGDRHRRDGSESYMLFALPAAIAWHVAWRRYWPRFEAQVRRRN